MMREGKKERALSPADPSFLYTLSSQKLSATFPLSSSLNTFVLTAFPECRSRFRPSGNRGVVGCYVAKRGGASFIHCVQEAPAPMLTCDVQCGAGDLQRACRPPALILVQCVRTPELANLSPTPM